MESRFSNKIPVLRVYDCTLRTNSRKEISKGSDWKRLVFAHPILHSTKDVITHQRPGKQTCIKLRCYVYTAMIIGCIKSVGGLFFELD